MSTAVILRWCEWIISGRLLLQRRGARDTVNDRVPVLIYGAGRRGKSILQELRSNRALWLHPIGFVDDDPRLIGSKICGVRVIGSSGDLASILSSWKTSALIISSHKIRAESLASVMHLCSKQRIPVLRGAFQLDRISDMGSSDNGEMSDQAKQRTVVLHRSSPKANANLPS